MGVEKTRFRFQNLEIWKNSIELAGCLFDIADRLEDKKLFRFSEQLRGSGMSISNNIAEGSGSGSTSQFKRYLDVARASVFETANIIILLQNRDLADCETANALLNDLELLSRKISVFRKTL